MFKLGGIWFSVDGGFCSTDNVVFRHSLVLIFHHYMAFYDRTYSSGQNKMCTQRLGNVCLLLSWKKKKILKRKRFWSLSGGNYVSAYAEFFDSCCTSNSRHSIYMIRIKLFFFQQGSKGYDNIWSRFLRVFLNNKQGDVVHFTKQLNNNIVHNSDLGGLRISYFSG